MWCLLGNSCRCDGKAASGAEHDARYREVATQTISDSVDRFAVRACSAPVHRKISSGIRAGFTFNNLLNRPNGFATAAHTGRIQGVSALFRDSAYLAKILGGATDGSNAGGSTVVYNLMSLPSIIANRGVPTR